MRYPLLRSVHSHPDTDNKNTATRFRIYCQQTVLIAKSRLDNKTDIRYLNPTRLNVFQMPKFDLKNMKGEG